MLSQNTCKFLFLLRAGEMSCWTQNQVDCLQSLMLFSCSIIWPFCVCAKLCFKAHSELLGCARKRRGESYFFALPKYTKFYVPWWKVEVKRAGSETRNISLIFSTFFFLTGFAVALKASCYFTGNKKERLKTFISWDLLFSRALLNWACLAKGRDGVSPADPSFSWGDQDLPAWS